MRLWLHAFVEADDAGASAAIADAGLRAITVAGVHAVVREVAAPPAPVESELRAYDALVRRLADAARALLPARFGTVLDDEAALARALEPHRDALAHALDTVAGREQMTLRVFGQRATTPAPPPVADDHLGPGARYMRSRLAVERARRDVPEIAPLRPLLAPLVVAERVDTRAPSPLGPSLLATVYHLVRRGDAGAYRDVVARIQLAPPAHAVASGPWPAYAFAPEALS